MWWIRPGKFLAASRYSGPVRKLLIPAFAAACLFAAACSGGETAVDDAVETPDPEPTTTTADVLVNDDHEHEDGVIHDDEGGHIRVEVIETSDTAPTTTTTAVPIVTTSAPAPTATTAAPVTTTTAPTHSPEGEKIISLAQEDACRANPHACEDPYALPHRHTEGNPCTAGRGVLVTDPAHNHVVIEAHTHGYSYSGTFDYAADAFDYAACIEGNIHYSYEKSPEEWAAEKEAIQAEVDRWVAEQAEKNVVIVE